MTREETSKILSVIDSNYGCFKGISKPEMTNKIDSWFWILEEYPFQDVGCALKTFIKTNGGAFAPNPSQLIAIIEKPKEITFNQSYLEEGEAWALVYKAICNSGYNSASEFDKLPDLVKRAVGSADQLKSWALSTDFNQSVESSNFKRQYKTLVEKDKEFQRLPIEFKQRIEQKGALLLGN